MKGASNFPADSHEGFLLDDESAMRRALELAAIPHGQTRPNPMVGCVIVKNHRRIGEGFHHRAGEPHAERMALSACTEDPEGSTVYVTLEPCNHHGRTPPCVEALIAARLARVVIAQRDPNPQAAGGVEALRQAGISVHTGVLTREAVLLNARFNLRFLQKRPAITLKWAMTLDGCTSTATGHSKWITGEEARLQVHRDRAAHGAVLVGIETALADGARLTVRDVPLVAPSPRRIVLDSTLRLPPQHPLLQQEPESVIVIGSVQRADSERRKILESTGATVLLFPDDPESGLLSLFDLVAWWHSVGIDSLYVEGGRRVAGSFFASALVDCVHAYINPALLGSGEKALSPLLSPVAPSGMEEKMVLHGTQAESFGGDFRLSGFTPRAWNALSSLWENPR
ncbi:MAG: bifunctional diaminohydroxyphosphoribosylaminopyrimidine deaminase/5-amino-6-(5-phosphoribosylamino)uracil reductase RibD [Candidatus Sumerlaeia bacterium]|nr:bifunctional diaminohydroxyphosphoribosylaminopyrimidine deaminase/5-amino-6-(5-phosphoribosylamino)uracil reductase RibD [Candidatus Sumerlaeia bacterium]